MPKVKGEMHPWWNGGKYLCKGYLRVYMPGHHRANHQGYVLEHILVAEEALGKKLPPNSVIHHANGTKSGSPLVICQDDKYHKLLHRRMKALKACGNAHWRQCRICKNWDDPENMYFNPANASYGHRKCRNEKKKEYRREVVK